MESRGLSIHKIRALFDEFWNKHTYFCVLFTIFSLGEVFYFIYNILIVGQGLKKSAMELGFEIVATGIALFLALRLFGLWSQNLSKDDGS